MGCKRLWRRECSGTSERAILRSVHPLSAIPGAAVARDLVLIVLEVKLVVVGQLRGRQRERRSVKWLLDFKKNDS